MLQTQRHLVSGTLCQEEETMQHDKDSGLACNQVYSDAARPNSPVVSIRDCDPSPSQLGLLGDEKQLRRSFIIMHL